MPGSESPSSTRVIATAGRMPTTTVSASRTREIEAIVASEPRWPRYIPPALLALAILALTLSFAKPERTVQVADRSASVMLVTDASGSMAATDVEPSRLEVLLCFCRIVEVVLR